MRLTVVFDELITQFEAGGTLASLFQMLETLTGLGRATMVVLMGGMAVRFDASRASHPLSSFEVTEGDVITVERAPAPSRAASSPQASGQTQAQSRGSGIDWTNAESVIELSQRDPSFLAELREANEPLAQLIERGDVAQLRQVLQRMVDGRRKRQEEEARLQQLLARDPLNPEAQRLIEESIRREQVEQNLAQALEETPEAFVRVTMLYVPVEVNRVPMSAFVDSGAQSTIMSEACARRANLMHLLDTRSSGIAQGVGTARILGRIHVATIKIGESYFPSSFTVLEGTGVDLLLGLDMLRRHQCSIDLKANVLRIGAEAVPFLSDSAVESFAAETGLLGRRSADAAAQAPAAAATPVDSGSGTGNNRNQQQSQPPQGFPQQSIDLLVGLGCPRDRAVQLLQRFNGNVDAAASAFFS